MSPHVLALDVAGAPHRWISVRTAAHYYATDMIAWAAGTNEFLLHDVVRIVDYHRCTLYRWMRAGEFPKRHHGKG
jgi:hypothetical protein